MDKMKIITNFVPRPIIWGFMLTPLERAEFDYYTDDEIESMPFFRYKGNIYDIGEFQRTNKMFGPFWHGYISNSYFSGILVHFPQDDESIVVGWYIS